MAAAADPADTILRRPVDGAEPAVVLGPTRLQGEFGDHLDALLAAGTSAPPIVSAASTAPDDRPPPLLEPVLAGIAGGAIGLFGGGYLGYQIDRSNGYGGEWDGVSGAVFGGLIGEMVLLPLGVHTGNADRGSYAADLGVSVLTGAAGLGLLAATGSLEVGGIAGVALQLASVVWTERRMDKQRTEARRAANAP